MYAKFDDFERSKPIGNHRVNKDFHISSTDLSLLKPDCYQLRARGYLYHLPSINSSIFKTVLSIYKSLFTNYNGSN